MIIEDNKPYGYKASVNIPRKNEISLWVTMDYDFNVRIENVTKEQQLELLSQLTENIKQRIHENQS